MQPINCIIIDDEPLARKGLKEYISEIDFLSFVGEFDNPLKATSALNGGNIQLLFLDIQMPKVSGLEFLKMVHNVPPVIFTTAFPQYALEGFELNALDYLVKPVSFERFLKAALKVKEYYEVREKNDLDKADKKEHLEYFFIKADNKIIKVFYFDILFVEALQNYVAIHTSEKKYISYLTFKSIEEYLQKDFFIKCHKSFIVSVSKVSSIDGNVLLIAGHHIPISRNYKDDVLEKLLKGKFLKR